ncbi:MAG: OadG family protein [Treponema sp.]|jgi:oxaloacetate decarboxylase gamma subunit|nr:OadG family protein [Treponema sp.]
MTIAEMLQQSAILTVLGMVIVFAFLWLMIICVNLVGKLVHSLGKNANRAVTPEITAAITAAVTEYRKNEQD